MRSPSACGIIVARKTGAFERALAGRTNEDSMQAATDFILGIPSNIILSIAVVIITLIVLAIVKRIFKRQIVRAEEDKGSGARLTRLLRIIHTTVRYLIIFVAFLTLMGVNGIDIEAIAAAAGAAGIILGFALKDLLEDFAMGARIVTDGYFKVGDFVEIAGEKGTVIAMTPQSTKIRSIKDDSVITFSNRLLQNVAVLGGYDDLDIGLPYELPAAEAERILTSACEKIKALEGIEDAQFKGTQEFGESAIEYRIRVFGNADIRPQLMRNARRAIQDTLEAEGVSCPYPQMDVHTK